MRRDFLQRRSTPKVPRPTVTGQAVSQAGDAPAARDALELGTLAVVDDAPADGATYGRSSSGWTVAAAQIPVGYTVYNVTHVNPNTDLGYGTWVEFSESVIVPVGP